MKSKRFAACILFAFGAGLLFSIPGPVSQNQDRAPQAKDLKPLVRKDLLANLTKAPAPPLRDIFHPKASSEAAAPAFRAGRPAVRKAGRSAPESPAFTLNLVYVGMIRSGTKTIALITRDGQTTPIAEGEEIIPGYRVLRITPDALDVEGPNAQRKTFSRQGDWP